MSAERQTWVRRVVTAGIVGATVITPLTVMSPAQARSLCAPPADTVPPVVTSFTFSKQSVDLDSGSRRVGITADVTDSSANGAPSGVATVFVDVSGPRVYRRVTLTLSSGTAAEGVWSGAFTVPATSKPGTWTVRDVWASDARNNTQYYQSFGTHPESPTDLRLQTTWDTSLTVTGTQQPPPPPPTSTPAGEITGFTISPSVVNTKAAAQHVHLTATFSAPYPKSVVVFFEGRRFFKRAIFKRVSASTWHKTITVDQWVGDEKAQPQLSWTYPKADSPRYRSLNHFQMQLRHFSHVLTITSGVDKTKPVLTSLAFSPASVDTTSGTQTVQVTAKATDTQSGVDSVYINEAVTLASAADAGPALGYYPYRGIGFSTSDDVGTRLTLVGGQWVGTLTFRKCIPAGTWKAHVSIQDKARNYKNYSTADIAAAGLPSTIPVTSTPGDVEAPYVRDATASGQDHTITVDFSEGVKNVSTSTLSVYALKPASKRYQSTTPVSGMTCSNGSTTVDCSGSGGLVTSAVLDVPAVVANASFGIAANQAAVVPQLTDGVGNPLDWTNVAAQTTGS